jgi:hypothetical protein
VTKAKTLTDQRADLAAVLEDAEDALSVARQRQRVGRQDAAREVLSPLADLHDAIRFNRPDAPPPDEWAEAKLSATRDLFAAVEERGLVLVPVSTAVGPGLEVIDPSIDADYDAALAAKNEAAAALREFDRDNADDLEAERKAESAKTVKAALASGDADAIREALARRDEVDERTARQRTADDLVSGKYAGHSDEETRRSAPAPDGALTTAG